MALVKNGGTLGLSILSAEAGFGIWSALLPSMFTIQKFSNNTTDMESIRQSMIAALGIMGVTAIGIYLAFGKKSLLPAASHVAVGLGLSTLYGFKIGWGNLLGVQPNA